MRFVQITIKKVEKMRKVRFLALTLAASILALSFAGCGYEDKGDGLSGKWAYIHEPEKTAFKVDAEKHTAVLDGEKYSCEYDSEFITLTDKKGNVLNMRYEKDDEDILLYKIQTYTYEGTPTPGSLFGVWSDPANAWSFEFTEDGTFREDGYFPGYFFADEEEGVIKLAYNDHFEDVYLYYTIDGDKLTVLYPWRMVRPE